jgi:2-polyprenyl-6-methoxyphenol hydroxylase-like FAD-dependent oxidoreductase
MHPEIRGSRVAVIGGSIAGCAAAIALSRAGCDVTVFERSAADLADRGFGIGLPASLHEDLVRQGYLDAATPYVRYAERRWYGPGPDAGSPAGRELARQQFPIACENWGVLWQTLRGKVPEGSYRGSTTVTAVLPDEAGARVVTAHDGRHYDLVVGADGYQSIVRGHVAPGSALALGGYGVWRGSYPVELLTPATVSVLESAGITFHFRDGHAGAYLIPGMSGGQRRLAYFFAYLLPARPFTDLAIRAPGIVGQDLAGVLNRAARQHFPPLWAELARPLSDQRLSVQPIYDATVARYALGRLALAGDAGALARPHTASGATTALQDALALGRYCSTSQTWADALRRYDRERCAAGNGQAELGRRLGEALITRPPDWAAMRPEDFARWWAELLSGDRFLYE